MLPWLQKIRHVGVGIVPKYQWWLYFCKRAVGVHLFIHIKYGKWRFGLYGLHQDVFRCKPVHYCQEVWPIPLFPTLTQPNTSPSPAISVSTYLHRLDHFQDLGTTGFQFQPLWKVISSCWRRVGWVSGYGDYGHQATTMSKGLSDETLCTAP